MHDDNHEIEFGIGGEQMANDLVIGNNVVVCESYNDEHLQLLLSDKLIHIVKESFTNDWGQTWYENDNVIGRLWYEWL